MARAYEKADLESYIDTVKNLRGMSGITFDGERFFALPEGWDAQIADWPDEALAIVAWVDDKFSGVVRVKPTLTHLT